MVEPEMEDQSDGSLRTENEGEVQKNQRQDMDAPVANVTSAPKASAKSILQQVALQASMLPDFMKNHMDGTPRSNQNLAGPSAEAVEPANEATSEAAQGSQVNEVAPVVSMNTWRGTNNEKIAQLLELETEERTRLAWATRIQPDTLGIDPSSSDGSVDQRVQAFAKLEFDDGEYYMNTYSVELGRDLRGPRKSQEKDNDDQSIESRIRSQSSGGVIGERGGIIVAGAQGDPRKKSRRKKSRSTSSSQQFSRKSSSLFQSVSHKDYQSLAMASLSTEGARRYNMDSRPEPEACPLVPIRPRTNVAGVPAGPAGQKTISRKHVKIAFNFEERLFEAKIVGRNGAFVDDQWYAEGHIQPLKNGSFIQIGGVGVRFLLPDVGNVAIGEIGADGDSNSAFTFGAQMSLAFVAGRDTYNAGGVPTELVGEVDDNGKRKYKGESREGVNGGGELEEVQNEYEEYEDDEGSEEDEEDDEELEELWRPTSGKTKPKAKVTPKAKVKAKAKPKSKSKSKSKPKPKLKSSTIPGPNPESAPLIPKRKGPGRPPKNGVISQREEALLKKQAKEKAKMAALEESGGQSKSGNGKSEDGNQEDAPSQPSTVKRKYTKRKSKDAQPVELNGVRESTEQTDSVSPEQTLASKPLTEKNPPKPPKPPRSPSPVFDESTLTPEQLAKPQSSYVVLIHEALSNSPKPTMTLPEIYRAIQRRYPYFVLRVPTNGWQSSVRHNLGQHLAFEKHERQGKGHTWGLNPNVSIEKEKRRRATPPSMPPQQYQPQAPHLSQTQYQYQGMAPPHGQIPPHMQHAPYGMPQGQSPLPQTGHIPSAGPNGLLLPFVNSQVNSSTYQSPYQSAPPAPPPQPDPQPPPPGYTNGYTYHPPSVPQSQLPGPTTSNGHSTAPYPQHLPNPPHNPPNPPENLPNPSLQHLPNPSPHLSNHSPHLSNNSPHLQHNSPQHQNLSLLPTFLNDPTIINNTSPEILQAIAKFSEVLMGSLPDKARGQAIISSAITRILDPKKSSTTESEDPEEKAIMDVLSTMLDNLNKKTHDAHRQAPQPRPSIASMAAHQQQPSPMRNQNSLLQPPSIPQQEAAQVHLPHQINNDPPDGGAPQAKSDTLNVTAPSPPQEDASVVHHKADIEPTNGNPPTKVALVENGVTRTTSASAEPEASAATIENATGDKRKLEDITEASGVEPPVAKRVDTGQMEEKDVPEKE